MTLQRARWGLLLAVIILFILPAPVLAQQNPAEQNVGAKVVEFVRTVILSGLLVYIFLAGIHVVTLLYAFFSAHRVLSYILGWMIAVFFIFFITISTGQLIPAASSWIFSSLRPLEPTELGLSVVLPSLLGLLIGYVLMELLRIRRDSKRLRVTVVTLLTTITILGFVTFGIGSLLLRNAIASSTFAFTIGTILYMSVHFRLNLRFWRRQTAEQFEDTWT